MSHLKVGVLALQGAFAKHKEMLLSLGVDVLEVRKPDELSTCDALIIPGGESTTMMRQINFIKMAQELVRFAQSKPVFGTCAGLILMSKEIISDPMRPFGLLDIKVERNAFGRQAESFSTHIDVEFGHSKVKTLPAVFIRAPRIRESQAPVEILATYENEPILVKQGLHLGASFHPELTGDSSIHRFFLSLI
jgi:pyridoxal 5'-phosphate synthase pdxT subunit